MNKCILNIILPFMVLIVNNVLSQTEYQKKLLDECNQLYKKGTTSHEIINYIAKEKGDLHAYQIDPLFDTLAIKAKNNKDYDACFDFTLAKIDNGCLEPMVLEDEIGTFFRTNYPERYNKMELMANKQFAEKSLQYYPNINLELAFTIRYLFRLDQRTKLVAFADHDQKTIDSLIIIAKQQDSITEKVLKNIFETYGYPGLSLIGVATSDVFILMHHLSTEFQIKYIHLLQDAILKKELYANSFDFLVDKILHKCCNKTIYGSTWSKFSPLTTDPDEIKRLKDLLKIK